MTVVVMTREMGTLGKDVARTFAEHRQIGVVHHEMVTSDGARLDGESEVYRFLESSDAEIDAWRTNRARQGYLTPREVLEIALEGDVLIRGWGATRLLRGVPNVLSVRVCAPMPFRVAVVGERLGVDAETARREIERNDAAHGRSFLRFFEDDWRSSENYDLVLNTAHMEPADCAKLLLDATGAPSFGETDAMKARLRDMLLKEEICDALRTAGVGGPQGHRIEATVDDGYVRLFGLVRDATARQSSAEILATQFGIRSFQNDISHAHRFTD